MKARFRPNRLAADIGGKEEIDFMVIFGEIFEISKDIIEMFGKLLLMTSFEDFLIQSCALLRVVEVVGALRVVWAAREVGAVPLSV